MCYGYGTFLFNRNPYYLFCLCLHLIIQLISHLYTELPLDAGGCKFKSRQLQYSCEKKLSVFENPQDKELTANSLVKALTKHKELLSDTLLGWSE